MITFLTANRAHTQNFEATTWELHVDRHHFRVTKWPAATSDGKLFTVYSLAVTDLDDHSCQVHEFGDLAGLRIWCKQNHRFHPIFPQI